MKMDLKENSLTEEIFFKAPMKYSRWIGMWPEDNLFEWKNLGLAAFSFITLIIIGMAQCAFVVDNFHSDLNAVFEVICASNCLWVSLFKLFVLFCLRQRLKRIITLLKGIWFNDQCPIAVSVNSVMAKKVHKANVIFVVGAFLVVTIYAMGPIVLNLQRLFTGQSYMRVLSFKSKYPFRTDTSPIYELTNIYVSISGYVVVLALFHVDGIFITLCVYIGAQFKIIEQNLLNLNKTNVLRKPIPFAKKYSKHECDKMLMQLARIIQRHVDTIQITNDVSELFVIIVLIQFLTAAANIGLTVSLLTTVATSLEVILYSAICLVYLSQLFIYCYGGTFIIKNSSEIALAAYEFKWYLYDKRVAKSIQLIILRAQHESCINVPFVQVSANSFLNILSTAGSYITILQTFM